MTVAMLAVFSAVLQQADTLPRTAAAFEVDPEESVFAVITHKAGFASRFAHNHFIAAGRFEARLEFTPEALEDTTFELEVNATDLVVDDPELREALASRLGALSVTDELGTPGDDDRREIRESMLDENQLDAERHPLIHARLVGLVAEPRQIASEPFPYTARVAFTVRGVTVERGLAARYTLNGGELWVEALGDLTFRAFGIEPYSAFLGSVKNEDQFHVYLSLRAVR